MYLKYFMDRTLIQQQIADAVSMDLPDLVEREVILPDIPKKTFAIIGMRRTGKTFFLFQQMKRHLEENIDRTRLVYLNFEDERLADMSISELSWISDEYFAMFPRNRPGKVYFFFDEIQLVEGWEKYIRRMMDTENVQIFISGSSAKMLSREIASSMRGRAVETIIYPFSFRETIKRQNYNLPGSVQRVDKRTRSLLENRFYSYLTVGGLPEAVDLDVNNRHLLIQGYVNTVLFRDIVDRHNATNVIALKKLIRHLIRNSGSWFTVNKFFNDLKSQGIKVGKTTLHEYLGYLQDAFLIKTIHIKAASERKRMVNPIKPYLVDTAIISAYSTKREPDVGRLLENCVFTELCRRNAKISYYITTSGYEVDFLVECSDGSMQLIQVSADISNAKTRNKEIRALFEAAHDFPDASLLLINLSEESEFDQKGHVVTIIPAWKWFITS